jgi:SWIM zinc finger
MGNTESHTAKCLNCGRVRHFRSAAAAAKAAPSGRICAARIRNVAAVVELPCKPEQHAKALELIEDGGIVRTSRPGVFAVSSSDGSTVYVTDANAGTCSCAGGQHGRYCYHLASAEILVVASIRRAA